MTEEEKRFVKSIQDKIKKYKIPVTSKEVESSFSGVLTKTIYNDKSIEIVDIDVEKLFVKKSYNYFIRKYSVISFPGKGYIPFDMYYIQEKVLQEFESKNNVIFLKTRQCGISTVSALYALWKMLDEDNLEVIDIISATSDKAKQFKSRMMETVRRMPLFLFPRKKNKKTGKMTYIQSLSELPINNTTQLKFFNGSVFKCETASENAGRGDSLSLLILDEAALFKTSNLVEEIWKSASPALSRTKGKSIVISTPSGTAGRGRWYYKRWTEARSGNSEFFPITIDWWEIPDIEKNNILWLDDLIKKDYYNHPEIRQIGVDKAKYEEEHIELNKWLKQQRDRMGIVSFRQEVLHEFIITGESVFSSEVLKKLKNRIKEPILKDKIGDKYIKGLWTWKKPVEGRKYIIGVDSSRGSGRDASGIQVLDPITYEQVAEYKGFVSTKRLGGIVKDIGNYYNKAYLIIECNNLGEATFNEVYYNEKDAYENLYRKTKKTKEGTKTIGWDTTPANRILMTEEFINFIINDKLFNLLKINSERMFNEMQTWVFEGSKPIHSTGMHDDLIISFCLALYNRFRLERKDDFIISSTDEIDYKNITYEDIQMMKENNYKDENLSLKQLQEERKRDKMFQRYGVDYYDYSWLLGFDPDDREQS